MGAEVVGQGWAEGRATRSAGFAVAFVLASSALLTWGLARRAHLRRFVTRPRSGIARGALDAPAEAAPRLSTRLAQLGLCAALGSARVAFAWPAPLPARQNEAASDRDPVSLTAEVAAAAFDGAGGGGAGARLTLEHVEAAGVPIGARVLLALRVDDAPIAPGRCIAVAARLRPVRGLANPGLPDPTLAWRGAGVAVFAHAAAPVREIACQAPPAWMAGLRGVAFAWHTHLATHVRRALSASSSAFVLGAALGERKAVPTDVEQGFRAAGATHVLSVSGLHLAALLAVALTGTRRLLVLFPRVPLWCSPAAVGAVVGLFVVLAFTLVSGEAIATVRAALMAASMLAAFLFNRRAEVSRSLALAVAFVLVVTPLSLLDISFQLSVLSVAALALAPRRAPKRRGSRGAEKGRVRSFLEASLARTGALAGVSLAATWGTTPLVLNTFGDWAPLGVLGNLLLVPLVELWVVPVALAGAALASFAPTVGQGLLQGAGWGGRLAMAVAGWFARHAPVWHLPSPNGLATALFTFVALASLALARGALQAPTLPVALERARVVVPATGLVAVACLAAWLAVRGFRDGLVSGQTRVTFLDVGQGDAAVVEGPAGEVLVVDAGGNEDGSFDPGELVVAPYLRRRGVRTIDLVLLSHPHPDHMNGLFAIFSRFAVTTLWTSGDDGKNPAYGQLLSMARTRHVATPVPHDLGLGALRLEVRGPFVGDVIAAPEGVSVNDASLVVRLSFAGRRVLLAGDVEAQGEAELLGRRGLGGDVAADVLKVPHHGSRTSSDDEFLSAVQPTVAVASLGYRNRFGFPHPEIAARYQQHHVPLLRTDRDGAVQIVVDEQGRLSLSCVRRGTACAAAAEAARGLSLLACPSPPAR